MPTSARSGVRFREPRRARAPAAVAAMDTGRASAKPARPSTSETMASVPRSRRGRLSTGSWGRRVYKTPRAFISRYALTAARPSRLESTSTMVMPSRPTLRFIVSRSSSSSLATACW